MAVRRVGSARLEPLYTTEAVAHGGRRGDVSVDGGALSFELAMPRELGGDGGEGVNPEQLFAAGFAACFQSSLAFCARQRDVRVDGGEVRARVGIGPDDGGTYVLAVELVVDLPGVDAAVADRLVRAAERVCPYSRATRGDIETSVRLSERTGELATDGGG